MQMNYLISTLIALVLILFLFVRSLYIDNQELKNAQSLIISGYEYSIKTLENKAKFEKEILESKSQNIKASEKVKIENQKRGEIENNISNDFVITSF